jgi:4-amino-4-deoxy-L-arabinose transferase-like glycosyltransferase
MKLTQYFDLHKFDNYEKLILLLCLFFLVVLILLSSFHEIAAWGVETDFYGAYSNYAKEMVAGEPYRGTDHGPGYVFILAIFYLIFGDVFVAGKVVTIISSTLFIFFTFQTIKVLFNSKLAFFTVLLLAIIIFPFSILASNDMFFAFIISLSIFLIFRNGKVSSANLLWGGIVSGYAFMTRMNGLILLLAVFTTVLLINPENWNWKKRLKQTMIYGLCFFATASPWFIMNFINYGSPLASLEAHKTIGASMLGQENESGDFAWGAETEAVGKKYNSLTSLVLKNAPNFTKYFIKNILNHFQKLLLMVLSFPAYLFFLPGILLLLSKINRSQLSYFAFAIFGFLIYCVLVFVARFYIYVLALFLLPIVYFLFYQNYSENKSFQQKLAILNKIFLGVIILFLLKTSIFEMKRNITSEPLYLINAAKVLKNESNSSDIVLARKPHLAFLSERKVELFPDVESLDQLISHAKEKSADYIFYGVKEKEARSQLIFLQDPEAVKTSLQLIYSQTHPEIYLYKVK